MGLKLPEQDLRVRPFGVGSFGVEAEVGIKDGFGPKKLKI